MEDELNICVDYGCEVLNVIVEHPVYGQLTGELHLQSRYDVAQFVEKVRREDAHSLSELTDGTHLHTLCCPTEELFHKVCEALEKSRVSVGGLKAVWGLRVPLFWERLILVPALFGARRARSGHFSGRWSRARRERQFRQIQRAPRCAGSIVLRR